MQRLEIYFSDKTHISLWRNDYVTMNGSNIIRKTHTLSFPYKSYIHKQKQIGKSIGIIKRDNLLVGMYI